MYIQVHVYVHTQNTQQHSEMLTTMAVHVCSMYIYNKTVVDS